MMHRHYAYSTPLLAEKNEDWGTRRHLEMDGFTEWAASKNGSSDNQNIAVLAG